MEASKSDTHQVFVKLLDGKHRVLNFTTPTISVSALKRRIQTVTSVPSSLHLLLSDDSRVIHDHQTLDIDRSRSNDGIRDSARFPAVVRLLLRLRGGKGGFGSLLRGAATKAGQKKTNNFDACRDMSGRRLRHVNAEKKLEEWRAGAEERRLEKMADEYISKKVKEAVKSGKSKAGGGTEKYVAKYREDSAKCMEDVERSVRESVMGLASSKRKNGGVEGSGSDSKRLKIWYGKRKLGESDSEDDSEEEDKGEDQKSVIIGTSSHLDSSKEGDQGSGSVNGGKLEARSLDQGSSGSGTEEEEPVGVKYLKQDNKLDAPGHVDESHSATLEETMTGQLQTVFCSEEKAPSDAEVISITVLKPVPEEVSVGVDVLDTEKPLNFDDYHSAAELEALGMERLKTELQDRGLKCGGTVQERASRLFLLKTTPFEKLPKKLFAKK